MVQSYVRIISEEQQQSSPAKNSLTNPVLSQSASSKPEKPSDTNQAHDLARQSGLEDVPKESGDQKAVKQSVDRVSKKAALSSQRTMYVRRVKL